MALTRVTNFGPYASTSSVTLTSITGVARDLYVLWVFTTGGTPDIITPTGYQRFSDLSGDGWTTAVFWRRCDGSETGNVVVDTGGASSIAWITAYRGTTTTLATLAEVTAGADTNTGADGWSHTGESVTTAAGDFIVAAHVGDQNSTHTGRAQTQDGATLGTISLNFGSSWDGATKRYSDTHIPVTAGASGAPSFTATVGNSNLTGLALFGVIREVSSTSWVTRVTTPTRTGTGSLRVTTAASSYSGASAEISTSSWQAGQLVFGSAYVRSGTYTGDVFGAVECYDSGWGLLANNGRTITPNGTGWTQISDPGVIIPTGTAHVIINIFPTSNAGGTWFIDDVSVKAGSFDGYIPGLQVVLDTATSGVTIDMDEVYIEYTSALAVSVSSVGVLDVAAGPATTSGSLAVTSTSTAVLGAVTKSTSGSLAETVARTGDLSASKSISGSLSVTASSAGVLGAVTKSISGSLAVSSASSAEITKAQSISGSLSLAATSSADLSTAKSITGSLAVTVELANQTNHIESLAESLAATATSTATFGSTTKSTSGALAVTATSTAVLGATTKSTSGSLSATATSTATFGATTKSISGSLTVSAASSADLAAAKSISAELVVTTSTSTQLLDINELGYTPVTVTVSTSATLTKVHDIAGELSVSAGLSGSVEVVVPTDRADETDTATAFVKARRYRVQQAGPVETLGAGSWQSGRAIGFAAASPSIPSRILFGTDDGYLYHGTFGSWAQATVEPGSYEISDILKSGTRWYAISLGGKLAHAFTASGTPSFTWITPNGVTAGLTSISQGGADFVITGYNGVLKYTTTPTTASSWTSASPGFSSDNINDAAYDGSSTWVAVGDGGKVSTSATPGGTWTPRSTPASTFTLTSVAYGGGVWVAGTYQGRIIKSTDSGATWTTVYKDPNLGNISDIIYANGRFTVGFVGLNRVLSSTDGDTWTESALGDTYFPDVQAFTLIGTRLVGVGVNDASGYPRFYDSPDGITFDPVRRGEIATANAITRKNYYKVVRRASQVRALQPSVGDPFGTTDVTGVAYGNGIWVAVGDSKVSTSLDGETWTAVDYPISLVNWTSLVFGGGVFVAAGLDYSPQRRVIATSPDGVAWTIRVDVAASGFYGLSHSGGTWVAVGSNCVYTASDPTGTWTANSSPPVTTLVDVAHDGTTWVAISDSTAYTATNPAGTWTQNTSAVLADGSSIAYGDGRWIIGDGNGISQWWVTTNPAGTWTRREWLFPDMSGSTAYCVAYINNEWIALGSGGQVAASLDGEVWAIQDDTASGYPISIASSGTRLVYGGTGSIWFADFYPPDYAQAISAQRVRAVGQAAETDTATAVAKTKYKAVFPAGDLGRISTAGEILSMAYHDHLWVATTDAREIFSSPDLARWTYRDLMGAGGATYASAVAYGNGYWVAINYAGMVSYSTDGISWTETTPLSGHNPMSVRFLDGKFVSVGWGNITNCTIAWTTDPSGSWTLKTDSGINGGRDIAFSGTTWAISSDDTGNPSIYTASTLSGTWTEHTTTGIRRHGEITYGPSGFAIAGVTATPERTIVTTSTDDGATWTTTRLPQKDSYAWGYSVIYGNGLYALSGQGGADDGGYVTLIWTSTDLAAWTPHNSNFLVPTARTLRGGVYGDGVWAFGADLVEPNPDYPTAFTSTDGDLWGPARLPEVDTATALTRAMRYTVSAATDTDTAQAVTKRKVRIVGTATGDLRWTRSTSETFTSYIDDVVYGNGVWVAYDSTGKLGVSTDGLTWVDYSNPITSSNAKAIAYGGGYWTITGNSGAIYTATDPTGTWTQNTNHPFGTSQIYEVDYGNGVWVARTSTVYATTTDPTGTWTQRAITAPTNEIKYRNGKWLGRNTNSATLYIAEDPTANWTTIDMTAVLGAGYQPYVSEVGYGNGLLVVGSRPVTAVSDFIRLAVSSDNGSTWRVNVYNTAGSTWYDISYAAGTWALSTSGNRVFTGPDINALGVKSPVAGTNSINLLNTINTDGTRFGALADEFSPSDVTVYMSDPPVSDIAQTLTRIKRRVVEPARRLSEAYDINTSAFTQPEEATGVAYHNGLWVAITQLEVTWSTDMTEWSLAATPPATTDSLYDVIYVDGTGFVALDGIGGIFTSTDGDTWTTHTALSSEAVDWVQRIRYNGTVWMAIGSEVWTSATLDGTWTKQSLTDCYINDLIYVGGNWVAVGLTVATDQAAIWTSPNNGVSWTVTLPEYDGLPSGFWLNCVTGTASRLVTAGGPGNRDYYLTSTDAGVTWTLHSWIWGDSNQGYTVKAMVYRPEFGWVVAGTSGWAALSLDGVNWTGPEFTSIPQSSITAMAYGNDHLLFLGQQYASPSGSKFGAFDLLYSDTATPLVKKQSFSGELAVTVSTSSEYLFPSDISAALPVTASTSADLTRVVDTSAELAVSTGLSATLSKTIDISAALAVAAAADASLDAVKSSSGELAGTATATADLAAVKSTVGELAVSAALIGTLDATKSVAGAASIAVTATGALDRTSAVSGELAEAVTLDAALARTAFISAELPITATIDNTFTKNAIDISAELPITATIDNTFTKNAIDISAELALTAGLSGSILADNAIDGTGGQVNVSTSGALDRIASIAGELSAAAAASAELAFTRETSAELAVTAAVDSTVEAYSIVDTSGELAVAAATSVALHTVVDVSAANSTQVSITSDITRAPETAASLEVAESAEAALARIAFIEPAYINDFPYDAPEDYDNPNLYNPPSYLSGSVFVQASADLYKVASTSGELAGTATSAGALDRIASLSGELSETVSTTGTLATVKSISGSLTVTESSAADLARTASVSGALAETATATGVLDAAKSTSGEIAATASATAALDRYASIAGALEVVAESSAALSRTLDITAELPVTATLDNTLTKNALDTSAELAVTATLDNTLTKNDIDISGALTVSVGSYALTLEANEFTALGLTGAVSSSADFARTASTSGELSAVATASGDLAFTRSTDASLAAAVAAEAVLDVVKSLSGLLSSTVSATASLGFTLDITAALTENVSSSTTLSSTVSATAALDVTASASGTLDRSATTSGALAETATTASALTAVKSISGALAVTASTSGTLAATKSISGELAETAASTATLARTASISGALTTDVASSADLTKTCSISGELAGTATVTGTLDTAKSVSTELQASTSTSADLSRVASIDGALTVTFSTTSLLTFSDELVAAMAIAASTASSLTKTSSTSAALAITTSIEASLSYTRDTSAALAVSATATADLDKVALRDIEASLSGSVSTASSLTRVVSIEGSLALTAAASADLARTASISGALAATATTASSLTAVKSVSGALPVTDAALSTLERTASTSGSLAETATAAAALSRTVATSAALAVTETSTASLARTASISGTLAVTATTSAQLLEDNELAGSLTVAVSTSAVLDKVSTKEISGTLAVTAATSAVLSKPADVAAALDVAVSTVGTLVRVVGTSAELAIAVGTAAETRTSIERATETDTAFPITVQVGYVADTVLETDTANPITARHVAGIASTLETDTATALVKVKIKMIGQALETETANDILPTRLAFIGWGIAW